MLFSIKRAPIGKLIIILSSLLPTAYCLLPPATATATPIYISFLWHMHQPIYWSYESIVDTEARGVYDFSLIEVHMTNKGNTVLYMGVTNDLRRRVYEHKHGMCKGFTSKYKVVKLVYYEIFHDPYNAIAREMQIKGGSRRKKIELINGMNSVIEL